MLHPLPALRPSMARIRAHPFFLPPDDDDDGGIAGGSGGSNVRDGGSVRDSASGTTKGGVHRGHPPLAKPAKIIRLFGEAPMYDVYFSYRRSCPSDKVTRASCT